MTESPLFATSREALVFAANHSNDLYQPPLMNRMLAEVARARRARANQDEEVEVAQQRRATLMSFPGLERAGQAGLILQLVAQLPDETIHVLLASVLRPRNACSCGAPCCSRWRINNDWLESVAIVVGMVARAQDNAKDSGKKFITPPSLLTDIVRQFFDRDAKETRDEIATRHDLSPQTITKHQKVLGRHLVGLVRSGFTKLDVILVDAGIVGALE